MSDTNTETEVLIVGAGPTGLALAIALSQAGVDHILIEKLATGQNTSRAAVIHAHTLEQLEPLGVVDELMRRGLHLRKFAVRDRDTALLKVDFTSLPSRYNEILMLPQDETERVLNDRLGALGGRVEWNSPATSIEEKDGRYIVRIQTPEGEKMVSARYVIAGDGMHSVVRAAAGIGFDGEAYAGSFVLADVAMDWPLGREEVSFLLSTAGPIVVVPLPHDRFRVVATMENAPEQPDAKVIEDILNSRGLSGHMTHVKAVNWSSRFRLHHRVASRYRKGRMFLMGDAAHVHSPAGGQGMNTGLVDSVVLGKILISVIKGGKPESELDLYERLRRPAALEVIALADRLTRVALVQGSVGRMFRNLVFRMLDKVGPFKNKLRLSLSGLDRKAAADVSDIKR